MISSISCIHHCLSHLATTPIVNIASKELFRRIASAVFIRSYSSGQDSLKFVPHHFSSEEAAKRFLEEDRKRLLGRLKSEEPDLPALVPSEESLLEKALIPIYAVNATIARTHFVGQYGIQKTVTTSNHKGNVTTYTYTNWYPYSGTLGPISYSQEDSGMCIYGGYKRTARIVEQAMEKIPFHNLLQPFDPKKIGPDTHIDPFLMRSATAYHIGSERIESLESDRAEDYISSKVFCHCTQVDSIDIELESFRITPYLLPAYLLKSRAGSELPPRIMPAINDKIRIVGPAALSPTKITAITAIATAALTVLIPPASFAIRVGMILLPSVISAIWARFGLEWRHAYDLKKIKRDKEFNESVAETKADRIRRELTEKLLPNQHKSGYILEIDEAHYIAMGLDPTQPITEEVVRKVFNEKIRVVHPDHQHTESHSQARKLILARNAMIEELKKQKKGSSGKRHYSTLRVLQVKEPPRSTRDLRAKRLIDVVLEEKNYEKARELVEKEKIHPDAHDKGENTLLSEAAKRGDVKAICFAIDDLEASPDTSCDCPAHRTPLHYAVSYGHEKVVRALLERDANPNLINSYGETALDVAQKKPNEKIINLLISHGAVQHRTLKGKVGFFKRITGYGSDERTKLLKEEQEKSSVISLPSKEKKKSS